MPVNDGATRAAGDVDNLYRAHAGEVYRYAYAVLGNRSDAEDVTQTTFVNALRALERGDRPRKPSNWLITIAHNIVRQRFRQQQARPAEVELDDNVACAEPHESSPSLDDLVRALQRIPPAQREALVMRELEGRSYKEIEAILELTPGALETMLFRARRSLAEELENLVTCERAEFAMSKQLDGRLSRKERRRLEEHLQECPSCARLSAGRAKHRRAFGALTLLPLPFSLTFFRETPAASAAGVTTIGAGGVTAAAGVTVVCGGAACATGGLLASGLAVKAVAVVAAATMAGSVGYEGVKHVRDATDSPAPTALAARSTSPLTAAPATLRGDRGSEPREALAAAEPPPAEDGYVLRVDPAVAPTTAPELPQEFEIIQIVELPVAAPLAPEPEPSPVLTITLPPVEAPPSAAGGPASAPPAATAPDTAAPPAADTTVTDAAPATPAADPTLPPADTAPVDATPVQSAPPAATDTPPPADTTPAQPTDPAPAPTPDPAPSPGAGATTDPTVTPASSTPADAAPAADPGTVVPASGG